MKRALVVLGLALAGPVHAQDAAMGEALFLSRCAGCHGLEGRGDGPMSQLLSVPVPDVTGLAARNDGLFPRAEAVRIVDGRKLLRGHGGPMPVFGAITGGGSAVIDGPDGAPIQTTGEVLDIVLYLETLQAE